MKNWQLIREAQDHPPTPSLAGVGAVSKETFVKRARILDLMREWFRKEGFLEVETPLMVKHPGMEPHLNLFSSEFVSEDGKYKEKRYLHTSPEYAMKKLLGAGFEKIFQITKVFRNGEIGNADFLGCSAGTAGKPNYCVQPLGVNESRHNPEFTMIEWYRANADYQAIMNDTEAMIRFIASKLPVSRPLQHKLSQSFERLSVRDAFMRYAKINLDGLVDIESLKKTVLQKGYELTATYSWDDLFFLIMLNEVEPNLGKEIPTFLYDYPASQAALAKKKPPPPAPPRRKGVGGRSFWAERFELYINGVELCNAFTELNDPKEQRARLLEERELRHKLGKEVYDLDEDFLEALSTMPDSGGNALGIDRLVMVLLEKKSIEEVLLFPWADS